MIDSIDKSLLKLLQEDSKKPNKYYANQLGLSNTCHL
jgi:DNA-binding Lrp family transcriptional regulator